MMHSSKFYPPLFQFTKYFLLLTLLCVPLSSTKNENEVSATIEKNLKETGKIQNITNFQKPTHLNDSHVKSLAKGRQNQNGVVARRTKKKRRQRQTNPAVFTDLPRPSRWEVTDPDIWVKMVTFILFLIMTGSGIWCIRHMNRSKREWERCRMEDKHTRYKMYMEEYRRNKMMANNLGPQNQHDSATETLTPNLLTLTHDLNNFGQTADLTRDAAIIDDYLRVCTHYGQRQQQRQFIFVWENELDAKFKEPPPPSYEHFGPPTYAEITKANKYEQNTL